MRHHSHDHSHGAIDPALLTTQQGIAAIKWSAVALVVTALIQAAVVLVSGSVALLADTIHNLADAASGLPLWLAFLLTRQPPTKRFTYGYGRAEDFAGLLIVLMIVGSGIVVAYESMMHLWNPTVQHLWAVGVASVIGFLGNEAVARYRLKVGHEIGSAALIADGHHARTDALSSLSVLAATFGVWLGMPMADPLVGLLIAAVILKIGWESGASIVMRMLDGVDPQVTEEVIHAIHHVPGVQDVTEVEDSMAWPSSPSRGQYRNGSVTVRRSRSSHCRGGTTSIATSSSILVQRGGAHRPVDRIRRAPSSHCLAHAR